MRAAVGWLQLKPGRVDRQFTSDGPSGWVSVGQRGSGVAGLVNVALQARGFARARAIVSMAWRRSSGRGPAALMVCGPAWISMVT